MTTVSRQRCVLHGSREAAARCPTCRNYYCRECVTEHDERLICAGCLKQIGQESARRRFRWSILAPVAGFLFAWFCFYFIAWLLARIPTDLWGTA